MKKILVTGATGYIGGRLVPNLLAAGYSVRCLVRDADRLRAKEWHADVEIVVADALDPESLPPAMEGCDVAYYLIHSMASSERGFEDRDRRAAENFGRAASRTGIEHIVYLGGLGDPEKGMSDHLESRQETGRFLAASGVPTTEFRAAIIVGSGSVSFEMIRYLTERLPIMITPSWVDTRVQPIAVRDVIAYLTQAAERQPDDHRIVEIGGPDIFTYRGLMEVYAEVRGLRRFMIPTPVLSPELSSYWINIVTPIPASIARPLVRGLTSEVVVGNPEPAKSLFDVQPVSYETAVKLALDRTRQGAVETLWSGSLSAVPRGTPAAAELTDTEGMLVDRQVVQIDSSPAETFRAVSRIGGDEGWYAFDWLWKLRGTLDHLLGGVGMRRGRRDPNELLPGDTVDFWRVESVDEPHHLQLRAEMKLPGRAWLRFDIQPADEGTELQQTAFFEPKGLFGYLYWWSVYPLHAILFPRMIASIAERVKAPADEPSLPLAEDNRAEGNRAEDKGLGT